MEPEIYHINNYRKPAIGNSLKKIYEGEPIILQFPKERIHPQAMHVRSIAPPIVMNPVPLNIDDVLGF